MTVRLEVREERCACGAAVYAKIADAIYPRSTPRDYPYRLFKCDVCDLVRTDPVPGIDLYTSGYAHSTTDDGDFRRRDQPWPALRAERLLGMTVLADKRDGRWLDLGCNGGQFVAELGKRSVNATGCDVDPVAVGHGRDQGLDLFVQDLTQAPLLHRYDVIVMSHTFEHIEDPSRLLVTLAEGLSDGGLLVLLVPNYGSLIARLMRGSWGFLVPQLHVWQFTPLTLRRTVTRDGRFATVQVKCDTGLEYATSGVKGAVKSAVMTAGKRLRRGDELTAIFRRL